MMTATLPRFASRSNGASSYTSRTEPLELDQVRRIAPSVFAEGKHASRSEKYSYIPTSEVLAGLMKEGFRPYAVSQGGSRDEEKRGFTKHMLRLRHDSQERQVGDTFSEIVLLNSHDGTSAYRLMAGVFRLVCSNGLVVSESVLEDVRVPHKGNVAGLVLDGCIQIMQSLPEVSESVREMDSIRLNGAEQQAFAKAALTLRYEDKESPVRPDQILNAQRSADAGGTIWQTFNVTQEHLVRGGVPYVQRDANGRRVARRQTREIQGIDQSTSLNRALWTLAEEMRKIKAA